MKLHSDEATSTAFPLAEAGLRVVSLNSDLEATPVLPSCAEPKLTHAHTSRVVAEATVSCATCWTAGEQLTRTNPQYSLPSSSVLDCGLTLTRTVLEAAHRCPRSTTSLPSSSVLGCGLTLTRRGCPPLPAFDDEPCAASRRHCTASSDLRSARDTARGEAITLTRRSGSY